MINLKISNVRSALDVMDEWPTKIISLLGAKDDYGVISRGDHHLILRFDDVDGELENWVPPSLEDVAQAMEFARSFTEEDKVLIHCKAGKSRSTAIAIAILVQNGMSPLDALDEVCSMRPTVIPNLAVMRHADDLLQMNGSLYSVIKEYYKTLPLDMPLVLMRRHEIED